MSNAIILDDSMPCDCMIKVCRGASASGSFPVAHTVTPRHGRSVGEVEDVRRVDVATHTCVTRTHGALVTRGARRALCEYARARVGFVLCHCVCSHVPLWCPLFCVRGR